MKLFVLPFAGGNRYSLNAISPFLPAYMKYVPVELPGRGARMEDDIPDDAAGMAEDIFCQILPQMDCPYALYGHCSGGLLAFLVARKIAEAGVFPPIRLFVCSSPAPSRMRPFLPPDLSREEVREALLDFGTPESLLRNPGFLEMIEPVFMADIRIIAGYAHQERPPLSVPVTVMLEKGRDISEEDIMAWQLETRRPLSVISLSCSIKEPTDELTGALVLPELAHAGEDLS